MNRSKALSVCLSVILLRVTAPILAGYQPQAHNQHHLAAENPANNYTVVGFNEDHTGEVLYGVSEVRIQSNDRQKSFLSGFKSKIANSTSMSNDRGSNYLSRYYTRIEWAGSGNWRPYAGLGYYASKEDTLYAIPSKQASQISQSAPYTYEIATGAIWDISERWDLQLAYYYTQNNLNLNSQPVENLFQKTEIEESGTTQVELGIHFNF